MEKDLSDIKILLPPYQQINHTVPAYVARCLYAIDFLIASLFNITLSINMIYSIVSTSPHYKLNVFFMHSIYPCIKSRYLFSFVNIF